MNIMSQMSQWSQASDITTGEIQPSQDSEATSVPNSQEVKPLAANTEEQEQEQEPEPEPEPEQEDEDEHNADPPRTNSSPDAPTAVRPQGFTSQWLHKMSPYHERQAIKLLVKGTPKTMKDYTEHLYKVACLLYDGEITSEQAIQLENKYTQLTASVSRYATTENPAESQLHMVVERCFDVFIKMAMNSRKMALATHTIRFLTSLVMALNYWELYNLLRTRPAIYQFLTLIDFDLADCYTRFMRDYHAYTHKQQQLDRSVLEMAESHAGRGNNRRRTYSQTSFTSDISDNESLSFDPHESGVRGATNSSPTKHSVASQQRKRAKPQNQRVVPLTDFKTSSSAASRSSNYDPDVVHECQLPAPENPNKVCLRRFSRKYELIRHQETVHSKKKKLFKCYVCVKQDPSIGPRIFTRHDTLAKHIRVNHRISGKEAKAEVAYSKKHAEIVEEGDITVQVGRRKTKVDFELRAHMEKKGAARQGPDGTIIFDEIDESAPDSIQSGDEGIY